MTAPHPPTNPEATPRKTDLTLTHVAAAALAAVTTAVIGSTLGTAGTLIGAAGASVITTVGTAVYRSSLERGRDTVRSLAHHTPLPLPSSRQGPRTTRSHPGTADAPLHDERPTNSTDLDPWPGERSRRLAPQRWRAVVGGAFGAFLLAMVLITGFEWANGKTIGGNGNGTTIGQVINDQPAPRNPAPSLPHNPSAPASDTPTAPDTTTPGGETSVEPSTTTTTDRPTPSTVTPPPPLIPTQLPGLGN